MGEKYNTYYFNNLTQMSSSNLLDILLVVMSLNPDTLL
jgi:hypothetical protein